MNRAEGQRVKIRMEHNETDHKDKGVFDRKRTRV